MPGCPHRGDASALLMAIGDTINCSRFKGPQPVRMEQDVYMPRAKYEQVTEVNSEGTGQRGRNEAPDDTTIANGDTTRSEASSSNIFPDQIIKK